MSTAESLVINPETESEFDSLIASGTVLVDFWAEWCGPCKMIAPSLDALADEYEDQVTVVKVNIDDAALKDLAPRYRVRGIPTLILFNDGEIQAVKVGGLTLAALKQMVAPYL